MERLTYEEYLKACNSPLWKSFEYDSQKVQTLTREEYEALGTKTQETQQ